MDEGSYKKMFLILGFYIVVAVLLYLCFTFFIAVFVPVIIILACLAFLFDYNR